MKDLLAYLPHKPELKFVISYDEYAGYYLYIYNIQTNCCVEDHLQDTLEFAKQDAYELYGVPYDVWV